MFIILNGTVQMGIIMLDIRFRMHRYVHNGSSLHCFREAFLVDIQVYVRTGRKGVIYIVGCMCFGTCEKP